MDKTDCLKNLTENIVKKQIDSIESIKNLGQAIDSLSADISNLINSLLMVGNRQFAENRVQDEEQLVSDQQMKHATPDPHSSQQAPELSLCSILNEALALLPQDDHNEEANEALSTSEAREPLDEPPEKIVDEPAAVAEVPADRVANILKKYSLYDEDEDEEEEVSE